MSLHYTEGNLAPTKSLKAEPKSDQNLAWFSLRTLGPYWNY